MEEERNVLNNENYHSTEMRKLYMGYSQFMQFKKCQKEALAMVNGEIEEKQTDAFSFGGYVDAYFSKELEDFVPKHPEMFLKNGELKATFKNVEKVIKTIEDDELLMEYLSGEHQVIMTGVINGVKFKIKIDSYHPGKVIVDQKIMKDMEPVWIERNGKNVKTDFIDAYNYAYEGAIYQEIAHQNETDPNSKWFISKDAPKIPFVLAVTTKEEAPDKALIKIDQEFLDKALAEVSEKAPIYNEIKLGLREPAECGKCAVCRKAKKLTSVRSYSKMFEKNEDIEY